MKNNNLSNLLKRTGLVACLTLGLGWTMECGAMEAAVKSVRRFSTLVQSSIPEIKKFPSFATPHMAEINGLVEKSDLTFVQFDNLLTLPKEPFVNVRQFPRLSSFLARAITDFGVKGNPFCVLKDLRSMALLSGIEGNGDGVKTFLGETTKPILPFTFLPPDPFGCISDPLSWVDSQLTDFGFTPRQLGLQVIEGSYCYQCGVCPGGALHIPPLNSPSSSLSFLYKGRLYSTTDLFGDSFVDFLNVLEKKPQLKNILFVANSPQLVQNVQQGMSELGIMTEGILIEGPKTEKEELFKETIYLQAYLALKDKKWTPFDRVQRLLSLIQCEFKSGEVGSKEKKVSDLIMRPFCDLDVIHKGILKLLDQIQ